MSRILGFSGKCIFGSALALSLPVVGAGPASSETVLHFFQGNLGGGDGANPGGGLISDKAGNLYGTTGRGGANDWGSVFKLAPGGTETVLYSFVGPNSDGVGPGGSLIEDSAGNLYGTTNSGGSTVGEGTVFKLAPNGTETLLHVFTGGSDGAYPGPGLIADSAGNFYGTTAEGGGTGCHDSAGCGTIFEIAANGSETILYSFCSQTNCSDGANPLAGLIADSNGNFYGTTQLGGVGSCETEYESPGCGTVFKLAPNGSETVLYSFQGGNDGYLPYAGLIADSSGNLYGTTDYGGGTGCGVSTGCGTVFKLAPNGTETVLYRFCAKTNCTDGAVPFAGLIMTSTGDLYGTTYAGGAGSACSGTPNGCGTVFRVAANGKEKVLYSFMGGSDDGGNSTAGLMAGKHGYLYGTAAHWGDNVGGDCSSGCGIVFDIKK